MVKNQPWELLGLFGPYWASLYFPSFGASPRPLSPPSSPPPFQATVVLSSGPIRPLDPSGVP